MARMTRQTRTTRKNAAETAEPAGVEIVGAVIGGEVKKSAARRKTVVTVGTRNEVATAGGGAGQSEVGIVTDDAETAAAARS